MAYDEHLAERVRRLLKENPGVSEKKMFGGLAFMLGSHMCCGVLQDKLVLRLGAEQARAALRGKQVREMDFTGRPLTGYVFVQSGGLRSEAALRRWLDQACAFVKLLPTRKARSQTGKKKKP